MSMYALSQETNTNTLGLVCALGVGGISDDRSVIGAPAVFQVNDLVGIHDVKDLASAALHGKEVYE
jgi:hypothetical protein